jgi:hypothetical protein
MKIVIGHCGLEKRRKNVGYGKPDEKIGVDVFHAALRER